MVILQGLRVECTVNPRLGLRESKIKHVEKAKKILVVGAGPAGLEAAVTAASRGHRVVVTDSCLDTGGMLKIASKPPYKDELLSLIEYYSTMIRKYNKQNQTTSY